MTGRDISDADLDPALVDAYIAGTLDAQGEAVLAEQVARVIPFHSTAPNPIQAALSRLIGYLGREPGLWAWLDHDEGRPRAVARLYEVMGLLDQFSDNPAVVSALRELRARIHYPPGLLGYLLPDTNEETLASLAGQIEQILAEDEPDQAMDVAAAALGMLEGIAPVAERTDPDLVDLSRRLEQVRGRLAGATARH
jgi:hypothetical protein